MNHEKQWTEAASKLLVGKKIASVSYLSDEERDEVGWDRKCLVIELDDGTTIMASQDDEGNGPGALFTSDEKLSVIPVI